MIGTPSGAAAPPYQFSVGSHRHAASRLSLQELLAAIDTAFGLSPDRVIKPFGFWMTAFLRVVPLLYAVLA